jgi:dihydrofolate reductase
MRVVRRCDAGAGGPDEDPSGGFKFGGWVVPFTDEVFGKAISGLFEAPFDLLLGRKTYEIFAAYWPYHSADDPIAKRFNAVTKYVATRKDTPLSWKESVALSDAAADVSRLKESDGPNLITQGSSDLIQTLLAHELVDEFRISPSRSSSAAASVCSARTQNRWR